MPEGAFPDLLADLVLFIDVARAGSLSQAAAVNGIALSTLSRRLAGLEKALGVRLIDRSTRRFRLTQEGELYAETLGDTILQAKGLSGNASKRRQVSSWRIAHFCYA